MPERIAVRVAVALAILACALALGWGVVHLVTEPGRQRARAAQANAAAVQAGARASAATDAIGVITNTTAAETRAAAQTEENARAITSTPGADAPVDPRLRSVALERLCGRRAYAADPRCRELRHAPP